MVRRRLPDGRQAVISPMTFGKGRICVGGWDDGGYTDGFCYVSYLEALAALIAWDPSTDQEPDGWIRHVGSGRRRPNGDASEEYVMH